MRDGGTAHSTPHFLEQRGGVERNHLPAGLKLMISRMNDGSSPGGKGMENVTQETSWRNLSHLSSAQPVQEQLLERGRVSQTGKQGQAWRWRGQILSMSFSISDGREGVEIREKDPSLWPPVTLEVWQAQTEIQQITFKTNKKKFLLGRSGQDSGTGYRFQNLHLWK